MATKKEVKKEQKKKVLCHGTGCDKTLTLNNANFYRTNRKDCVKYDGFYPICKSCFSKIMLNKKGEVTEDRFKAVCQHLDIVFIPNLYKDCVEKNGLEKNQMRVLADYRSLLTMNATYRDLTFSDSVRFELQAIVDEELREEAQQIEVVDRELIEFWGEGIDPRLYKIYQKEYEMLCLQDGGVIEGVKQNYFKTLAILTHTAQQQLLANDLKGHETTMKTYTSICEKCGINPKQVQDKDESNRGTFGVFIRMIEDEEPILDPEKDLGTVDVVRRCLEVFFFGHLAEVQGFRNPLKCKYDEVMQQYSVRTETYEDLMNIEQNDEEIAQKGLRRIFKVRRDGKGKLLRGKVGDN